MKMIDKPATTLLRRPAERVLPRDQRPQPGDERGDLQAELVQGDEEAQDDHEGLDQAQEQQA